MHRGHKVNEVEFSEFENLIHMFLADNEFVALREDINGYGVEVNITAKDGQLKKKPEKLFKPYPMRACLGR
jgi:hypothetical protein